MISKNARDLLRDTRPQPPAAAPLVTGVAEVDRLLGAEGLAVGRITEWVGAPSSGKTGVLRTLISRARRRGLAVAYVDGTRTLCPADWADEAPGLLWVVRPSTPADAPFCAELLLRARGFDLLVLDGAPPLDDALGVRLQRLARRAAAALVVVREARARAAGGPVASRLAFAAAPDAVDVPLVWRIEVARERGAPAPPGRLYLSEPLPNRLAAHPAPPDRPATRTRPQRRGRVRAATPSRHLETQPRAEPASAPLPTEAQNPSLAKVYPLERDAARTLAAAPQRSSGPQAHPPVGGPGRPLVALPLSMEPTRVRSHEPARHRAAP
jgi:hypothetical protein